MKKRTTENIQLGQVLNSEQKTTDTTSRQTIANTHVVGSQSHVSHELACNGKPFPPDLTCEQLEKLSWFEKPYWFTKEGSDWWHHEQMKRYDLSSPQFQRKMRVTNYFTYATVAILFLLLVLEVLTIRK